jgi:5'-nucleotidase
LTVPVSDRTDTGSLGTVAIHDDLRASNRRETPLSATPRRTGRALVAAAAGLGLVASPLALSAADADEGAVTTAAPSAAPAGKTSNNIKVDLFALNDFHGQLEVVPSTSSGGRVGTEAAGGAEYLATHLKQLRAASADRGVSKTFTVAAGDLIGATPLLSAAFHDEPTIEAMNELGLDVSSVGNHEFDEGYRELKRMQKGGCLADGTGADNQNSCPDAALPFEGADFKYLAANVKYENTRKPIFAPFNVKKVDGQKVAFIGMTLEDTPNIVTKSAVEGLFFKDEVKTVNKLVPRLKERGVKAMVVLLHEGGFPAAASGYNECEGVTGPGIDIAKALDPAIDVVISGHTHQPYNCTVRDPKGKKRLVTSAFSTGRIVTEVRLKLRSKNGEVIRSKSRAINHVVTNADGTAADAAITALITRYKTLVAPIENRVLGKLAPAATQNSLTRTPAPDGADKNEGEDFALGNLIADSQKTDPSVVSGGKTPVIALMNPGGIRADLSENAAGDVTYGTAFSVQPFNNYVVSMDLTGAQIRAVLNEQWNGRNEAARKILQVSGLDYTYNNAAASGTGDAIVGDILVDLDRDATTPGVKLDPAATYRVVVNSFLSDGGDGFGTLAAGTDKFIGGLDIDALARYLAANNPYTPGAEDRIDREN